MNTKIMYDLFKKYDLEEAILIAPLEPFKCISKKEAMVVVEQNFEDLDEDLIHQTWVELILKYFEIQNDQYKLNTHEIDKLLNSGKFTDEPKDYNGFKDINDQLIHFYIQFILKMYQLFINIDIKRFYMIFI